MQFSIIIPVYNVSPYLRACLDSVLGQTDPDWEAICVDDGSTDESGAILDEYAARDSRFRVLHKKNGGGGSARNAGLDIATGDWHLFLDSDDCLLGGALANIAKGIAVAQEADLVHYRYVCFDEHERPASKGEVDVKWTKIDVSDVFRPEDVTGGTCCFYTFRRSKFADVRFGDYCMGEDRVYLMSCLARTKCLVDYSGACYAYRMRATSVTHVRVSMRHIVDTIRFVIALLSVLQESGKRVSKRTCREFGCLWTEWSMYHYQGLSDNDRCEVWQYWLDSLRQANRFCGFFTAWRRFVFFVCQMLPLKMVAWVVCILPYKLKVLGIHR